MSRQLLGGASRSPSLAKAEGRREVGKRCSHPCLQSSSGVLQPFPHLQPVLLKHSYRAGLSLSQGEELAQIYQLKVSKAFGPDWNLSQKQTNKQKSFSKSMFPPPFFFPFPSLILVKSFLAFSLVFQVFIFFSPFLTIYKCIPVCVRT